MFTIPLLCDDLSFGWRAPNGFLIRVVPTHRLRDYVGSMINIGSESIDGIETGKKYRICAGMKGKV